MGLDKAKLDEASLDEAKLNGDRIDLSKILLRQFLVEATKILLRFQYSLNLSEVLDKI